MEQSVISKESYVGGTWIAGKGKEFWSHNPATGEKGEAYREVDAQQVDIAVKEAADAFEVVKKKTMKNRADLLDSIAQELEDLGDELIEVCNSETGLGEARLKGERARTCGQLRAFANVVKQGHWQNARIDTAIPDRQPLPKPDIRRIFRPLGTIAVFSASNFPLAFSTLGGDTASALASGNCVVVKAHPSHPGTSKLCAKAMQNAILKNDYPPEMFAMLQGVSPEISQTLVLHPQIKAVGFTGSTHVGKILFNLGASRPIPIPVFAEMGSTNPLVLLPKALANHGSEIAKGLANSMTLGTGQFCTKPGLILLLKDENSPKFVDQLNNALASIDIGYFLNPKIESSFHKDIEKTNAVTGNQIVSKGSKGGKLFEIDAEHFLQFPSLEEEIFGPAAILITCQNLNHLIQVVEKLSGHLTGTIFADGDVQLSSVIDALENKVGRIIFNGFPTGVEVCPSMHHGGPFPSSTFEATTSVGTAAIERFCTVKCYQNIPQEHLPEALQDQNPDKIVRMVNGIFTTDTIQTPK